MKLRDAAEIANFYESDATAPTPWHLKPTLRSELRSEFRRLVKPLGREAWTDVPVAVEEFAGRECAKS